MPRVEDRDARRELIADALVEVIADGGLAAVSLRHVAAAAGVSAGMVQHYFPTKHQMMMYALVRARSTLRARVVSEDAGLSPRSLARSLLRRLLPSGPDDVRDLKADVAFLSYAGTHEDAAGELCRSVSQTRAVYAERVRAAYPDLPVSRDPEHISTAVLALIDGLALRAVEGACSREAAISALDQHLDLVFGAESVGALIGNGVTDHGDRRHADRPDGR